MVLKKVHLQDLVGGKIDNESKKFKIEFYDGYARNFVKAINFKKFYNSFHDFLVDRDYVDVINVGKGASPTELPDKSKTRSIDIFETSFLIADRKDAGKEYDIWWECKKNVSNGILFLKFNIVSRFFLDKDGLQDGKWEIYVWAHYENNFGEELSKTFLVKNLGWIADWVQLSYDYIYRNKIENDINECKEEFKLLWGFIESELT